MNKKILIVDDEPHIRALLEEALEEIEDLGVEILIAEDGEAGLALVKEEKPRLVLLDVMMPKMNGFEVAANIRNDSEINDTYIIMLTAKGQEVDRSKGIEVGANEYVTKPFDPDYIVKRAGEILEVF